MRTCWFPTIPFDFIPKHMLSTMSENCSYSCSIYTKSTTGKLAITAGDVGLGNGVMHDFVDDMLCGSTGDCDEAGACSDDAFDVTDAAGEVEDEDMEELELLLALVITLILLVLMQ